MEIRKLKKRLLKEERKRRRKTSKGGRFLLFGALAAFFLLLASGIFFFARVDKGLKEDYSRAEQEIASGNYEEAVRLFRGIYEKHPRFPLAHRALLQSGEVLELYLRRPEEALLAYLRVEKDYPKSSSARKARRHSAEIYKRLRDHERALITYQRLLDEGGSDAPRLHYEVADAYFRLENLEQSRIEFETLARNYPESPLLPEVTYRVAVLLSLEGKGAEAEKTFREVIALWPGSPYAVEARLGLSTLFEEREELHNALKILEGLRGIYPNRDVLETKIAQISERIRKKRRAA